MAKYSWPLIADRWTPYVYTPRVEYHDYTGATLAMHIRQNWDATGTALLALANASAGSQGLSIATVTVDGRTHTDITIQIDETTLEGLMPPTTSGAAPGSDVALVYDLHVTPSGGTKFVLVRGAFTIIAGATQNA